MKKAVILGLFTAVLCCIIPPNAGAQSKGAHKKVSLTAKAVDKSRGSNPNITSDMPTTDEKKSKSRGDCSVYFNNYTGYYIKVYMDGIYWGMIAPYGGLTVADPEGYTRIYCVTAGGSYEWIASGGCDHAYEYKLSESTASN